VLEGEKQLRSVRGRHIASGENLAGYEIHMGRTAGPDCARPFAEIDGKPDGATSSDGRISGTYLHGLFASDRFRTACLQRFGAGSDIAYEAGLELALDELAGHLERHVDADRLIAIARGES
jgi:adenosylcobyric acid synthase